MLIFFFAIRMQAAAAALETSFQQCAGERGREQREGLCPRSVCQPRHLDRWLSFWRLCRRRGRGYLSLSVHQQKKRTETKESIRRLKGCNAFS